MGYSDPLSIYWRSAQLADRAVYCVMDRQADSADPDRAVKSLPTILALDEAGVRAVEYIPAGTRFGPQPSEQWGAAGWMGQVQLGTSDNADLVAYLEGGQLYYLTLRPLTAGQVLVVRPSRDLQASSLLVQPQPGIQTFLNTENQTAQAKFGGEELSSEPKQQLPVLEMAGIAEEAVESSPLTVANAEVGARGKRGRKALAYKLKREKGNNKLEYSCNICSKVIRCNETTAGKQWPKQPELSTRTADVCFEGVWAAIKFEGAPSHAFWRPAVRVPRARLLEAVHPAGAPAEAQDGPLRGEAAHMRGVQQAIQLVLQLEDPLAPPLGGEAIHLRQVSAGLHTDGPPSGNQHSIQTILHQKELHLSFCRCITMFSIDNLDAVAPEAAQQ